MNFPVAAFIGWRYANSSKSNHFVAFINFFSITGIALGLMALILVSSVMNGFENQLKQRILGLMPHFVVEAPSKEVSKKVADVNSIQAAIPFAEFEGVIQSPSGLKPVMMQGIEPISFNQYSNISENLLIGGFQQLIEGEFGIVIGRALAGELNVRVGQDVRIITAESSMYTLFGRQPAQRKFRVVGIFEMGSELDDKVVLMNILDLSKLLRKKPSDVEQTRLFLQDAFDYLPVRDLLNSADFTFQDWRSRQGPLFDAVKMEKNMMALMLLLIIAVAAFNIVSALVMVVTEKRGDIAILLTQGMNKSNILNVFLINGLSNGVKGTAIGTVLGLLLTYNVNEILLGVGVPLHLFLPEGHLPIVVNHWQLVVMVLMSFLLCFVATLYPAYKASNVKPAEALRYE